jgi:hypothetical protein
MILVTIEEEKFMPQKSKHHYSNRNARMGILFIICRYLCESVFRMDNKNIKRIPGWKYRRIFKIKKGDNRNYPRFKNPISYEKL